jgi:hypothetical protein
MDGSQIMTQKIVGTVGNAVSQVTPLKTVVDSTGRIMSNVLGSTSRLLGKDVRPEHEMMFLYSRQLTNLGTARQYQNAIKEVIGLALYNVVLHGDEMEGKRYTGVDAATMPVLDRVVKDLQMAGAGQPEIDDIVWLLGRNGKADIPEDMEKQVAFVYIYLCSCLCVCVCVCTRASLLTVWFFGRTLYTKFMA